MSCQLTLFIPELLNSPEGLETFSVAELPELPAMLRLLSRAEIETKDQKGFYPELFASFGLNIEQGDYPLAAMTHFLNGGEQDRHWRLRIDPVYMRADMTAAYLLAHEALQLQAEEAAQITETLNQHFQQDGWQIEVATSHCWYLTGTDKTNITTTSLHQALGQNVDLCLPTGKDAAYWRAILNEAQMLLHQHPVNEVREAEGRLPVSSIWLWGGGVLPDKSESHWSHVYSNEPVTQGLAQLSGVAVDKLLEANKCITTANDETILIVDDSTLARQHGYDIYTWLSTLQALEKKWFAPLLQAMQNGKLQQLDIMSGDGRHFQLNRRVLRRWWRRDKGLHAMGKENNEPN